MKIKSHISKTSRHTLPAGTKTADQVPTDRILERYAPRENVQRQKDLAIERTKIASAAAAKDTTDDHHDPAKDKSKKTSVVSGYAATSYKERVAHSMEQTKNRLLRDKFRKKEYELNSDEIVQLKPRKTK